MSEDKPAEAAVDVDDKKSSDDEAPGERGLEFQKFMEEKESSATEDPSGPAEDSPPDLRRALDEARSSAQANWDTVLRTRAELDNVRKRAERDIANAHRYGLERVINEFLPIRDSLELGLSAAEDEADVVRIREGIALTLKLMETAFDKLGLEVLDPEGKPFDPDLHQAMSMQEGEEGQSGIVLGVVQKGYRLKDRLIRPALVVVAK